MATVLKLALGIGKIVTISNLHVTRCQSQYPIKTGWYFPSLLCSPPSSASLVIVPRRWISQSSFYQQTRFLDLGASAFPTDWLVRDYFLGPFEGRGQVNTDMQENTWARLRDLLPLHACDSCNLAHILSCISVHPE